MRTSEDTDKIALAYVAAFTAMTNPATDKRADTGKFSYPYLSLPALLDAIRAELPAHGLAIAQEVTAADRGIGVTTRIIHTSGQWYETGPLVVPAGHTAQEHGSAITYARRYALAAAVGLAPEEDDDGAKASRKTSEPTTARGSDNAGTGAHPPPASVPAPPSELGEANNEAPSTDSTKHAGSDASGLTKGEGEAPAVNPATCSHPSWKAAPRAGWELCERCGNARKAAA